MNYKVIVHFNDKGRRLVGKSTKILTIDCKSGDLEVYLYDIIPKGLISKYEIVADFNSYSLEGSLVRIVNETDSNLSFFGEILGVDYVDDKYLVFVFDFNDILKFSILNGKARYYKQSYYLRHIENDAEKKIAQEKSEITKKVIIKHINSYINNNNISLNKLRSLLKVISE